MKILFEHDADYDVYKKYYYPLMVNKGFSWKLFPELTVNLDMRYEGWSGGINSDKEHFNPNNFNIFVRMITEQEWIDAGNDPALYERITKHYPSSLVHEIMHYIHTKYFGADGSKIWLHALALIGETPDFKEQSTGSYWWKQSYEAIANYFEACIEGRKNNPVFLQFIRDLIGVKAVFLTDRDYIIEKDSDGLERAFIPTRKVVERMTGVRLQEIHWDDAFRQVVIIGGDF